MTKQRTPPTRKLSPDKPGFHILLAIVVTVTIFALAVLFLRIFTRHGHEVEMPSYYGQPAGELTQRGRSEGFVFEVSDELYDSQAEPGTVLKQNPMPGEKVKHGRKVYLTVAAAEPPTIKMLELRDLSLRQAQIMIESQGLVLERVIEKPSPYENVVLEVLYKGHSIAQGTPIKQGEKINLNSAENIVAITQDTRYTVTSPKRGTTFVVTALDRLHNESKPAKVKL